MLVEINHVEILELYPPGSKEATCSIPAETISGLLTTPSGKEATQSMDYRENAPAHQEMN